ncbi:MAG TPA: hypothetical protein VFU57_06635 [Candidatus Acidoferrales bacterium]|nr:hypothetical protein [Candidatus Acidoferrales bacterium]
MNNAKVLSAVRKFGILTAALAIALCFSASLWAQSNSKGESFYIISSVNFQTQQIVLMQPTQLTVVANFTPQTAVLDENGKKLTTKDLKAGDTVWAVVKKDKKNDDASVSRIRMGAMTQSELRKLYLNYPANGTPNVPIRPIKPTPETGVMQPQSATPGAQAGPGGHSPAVPGTRQPAHPDHVHARPPHGPGLHT